MPPHDDIVLAHEERFKTIFNRLDKADEHVKESGPIRTMVTEHEVKINGFLEFKKELRVWGLGIIITLVLGIFWLGGRFTVLEKLEDLHKTEIMHK